jgi:cytochrome c5
LKIEKWNMLYTGSPYVKTSFWICFLCVSAIGCGSSEDTGNARTASVDAQVVALPAETSMQKWAKSCALCHVDGTGGAPMVGHAEAWAPRLAQGRDVLMRHTIEGFNNMPPLGYCMSCEAEDFSTMIDFMTNATGESR